MKIFEQDGTPHTFTKASTFDDSAATLVNGDIIEAETDLSEDKKYLNLKKITKLNTEPTCAKPITEPAKPGAKTEPGPVRTARDESIDQAVAIKAITELASNNVLPKEHPLVTAVTNWCTEKLRNYLSMGIDIPVAPEKPVATPPDAKPEGCGVDMEWLREFLKKLKWEEGTAMSWIEATFKVKRAGTLEDTIMLLTKDQKGKLCDFVAKAAK